MNNKLAPVALFIFNRPEHLRRTIEALQRCDGFPDSPIFVFADGARDDRDIPTVDATRRVARELLGDRAEYHLSQVNKGLATSIISGVELLLARYGRVIVLEDDLLVASSFLRFLNDALDRYADNENIYQVSGHMYEVGEFEQRQEALLLPLTTTWGWATWARAWTSFDPAAQGWEALRHDRMLRNRFNLDRVYDYALMLERQMAGQRQSWGIRWYWSVFLKGGLGCFPPQSLVANIGFDGTGTNGRGVFRSFESKSLPGKTIPFIAPDDISPEPKAWAAVRDAIWRQNGGWGGYVVDWVHRIRWRLVGKK